MSFLDTYRPSPELQDVVELYWRSSVQLRQPLVQEMFTPALQALTFNLGGQYEDILLEDKCIRMDKDSYIIGQPRSRRVSWSNPKGIDILGVKFTPLGLYLLTGINMKLLSDQIIEAGEIWNNEIRWLHEELLEKENIGQQIRAVERFLIGKKREREGGIHPVNRALSLIENKKIYSVAQLREESFVTKKTFERYFLNYIGVSPKQYATICRFNHVLAYLNKVASEPEWQEVVVSFGYHDHSHLVRDFKRYAGKTPTEYLAERKFLSAAKATADLTRLFY